MELTRRALSLWGRRRRQLNQLAVDLDKLDLDVDKLVRRMTELELICLELAKLHLLDDPPDVAS
jgi:hypothetical protein